MPRWVRDPSMVCVCVFLFVQLLLLVTYTNPRIHFRPKQRPTFPDPVTPRVASSASVPSPPYGAKTPSTKLATPVQWKMSSCVASSSKTWVKANFSTARRRSLGGLRVMCLGGASLSVSGCSTCKKRSPPLVVGDPLLGRSRR